MEVAAIVTYIDGRDVQLKPGPPAIDAVHRFALLRFPGLLERLSERITAGQRVKAARIELSYAGYEVVPEGYILRDGVGRPKWSAVPPNWHIVGWPLALQPDLESLLSSIKQGTEPASVVVVEPRIFSRLSSEKEEFGPAELSVRHPLATVDLTSFFADAEGAEVQRKRVEQLETDGIVVRKLETYDANYRNPGDFYEWTIPTGGHGLRFSGVKLFVEVGPANDSRVEARLNLLLASPALGSPDSMRPNSTLNPIQLSAAAQKIIQKPGWMTETQYAHAMELLKVGGDSLSVWVSELAKNNAGPYEQFLRKTWQTLPRYWKGWEIEDDLISSFQLGDLLPEHIRRHLLTYWTSYLMPDIPTSAFFAPHSAEATSYIEKTGDWRGRASFFRDGYTSMGSTQNFNHTASLGALLGGRLIGSDYAMADGRNGVANLLLRYWSFLDGSSQEVLDHYYLSITLSAQKMLADFGPTLFDRLAGRTMLERTMEMLATIYHPKFKRFVAPSQRVRFSGTQVEQDGIYGALHVLSNDGVVDGVIGPFSAKDHGMPVWGYDFPPGRVGLQSLTGPWAPKWFAKVIDEKPAPFLEISAETIRGNFNPPLWRSSYLGTYYGLSSQTIKGGTVDLLAQWTRVEEPSRSLDNLGTLTLRYCINDCDLVTTKGGVVPVAGRLATLQDKNRAIVVTGPLTDREMLKSLGGPKGLTSLSTIIGLWNFQEPATWTVYVDGKPLDVNALPLALAPGDHTILLRDGPTYVALRPLPATDLGRGEQYVTIARGGHGGKSESNGAFEAPVLTIEVNNLRSSEPVPYEQVDWTHLTRDSFGGFVIEMGDRAEYSSFENFTAHIASSRIVVESNDEAHLVHVSYRSGATELAANFGTDVEEQQVHFPIKPGQQTRALAQPKVNGKSPFLEEGLERDTSWSQQGTSGRLEKNGVVLETEPGQKAYLIATPSATGVLAYNPQPDPTPWKLTVPGGVVFIANGKVGLFRLEYDRENKELMIDHAVRKSTDLSGLASTLSVVGLPGPLTVVVNGRSVVSERSGGTSASLLFHIEADAAEK